MAPPNNTAEKLIKLPDKIWLFIGGLVTWTIGIVVSYMMILNTQTILLDNDLRLQQRIEEISDVLSNHALLINTNAVRIEGLD